MLLNRSPYSADRLLSELPTEMQQPCTAKASALYDDLHELVHSPVCITPDVAGKLLQRWRFAETCALAPPQPTTSDAHLSFSLSPLRMFAGMRERSFTSPSISTEQMDTGDGSLLAATMFPMRASTAVTSSAFTTSRSETAPLVEDVLISAEIEELRWAVAYKIAHALLRWWLDFLLGLSWKASCSLSWWRKQHRRPVRHFIWRSSGALLFGAGASPTPFAALSRLEAALRSIARRVGVLKRSIHELECARGDGAAHSELKAALQQALCALADRTASSDTHSRRAARRRPSSVAAPHALITHHRHAEACGSEWAASASTDGAPACGSEWAASATTDGAPAPLEADTAPAVLVRLAGLCASCEHQKAELVQPLEPLARPSHVSRHRLAYSALGAVGLIGGLLAFRRRAQLAPVLRSSLRNLVESVRSFWREHVASPASRMWRELVQRQYLQVSDPAAIEDAKELLGVLQGQFIEKWGAELRAAASAEGHQGDLFLPTSAAHTSTEAAEVVVERASSQLAVSGPDFTGSAEASYPEPSYSSAERTGEGEGAAAAAGGGAKGASLDWEWGGMSRLFAQQMASPAWGLMQGPLLQLLLIQTQSMRSEMLEQMAVMDQLVRENFFTAQMSALLPGVLSISSLLYALRRLLRSIRSHRRSRGYVVKKVQKVVRNAERLLLAALAAGHAELPDADTGLLLMGLDELRRSLERHGMLLGRDEREALLEDVDELESPSFAVELKLQTLQRMYRTQPSLCLHGKPAVRRPLHEMLR
uniref:Nuclear control of ATPase protein 2 n=1 Tax=Calcidiscus leptoporus TaxID=127549 RepID=A0A7S0P364_9EUKA|mmetsp:Transcript_54032/g.124386  ORF Transcript_54032/g.124386 Transcript_54032/m.124386 type:complete len:766 (+) Transcript_54032:302-2599(+)